MLIKIKTKANAGKSLKTVINSFDNMSIKQFGIIRFICYKVYAYIVLARVPIKFQVNQNGRNKVSIKNEANGNVRKSSKMMINSFDNIK